MALYDLADSATPLPIQLALDSSLLLALRKGIKFDIYTTPIRALPS